MELMVKATVCGPCFRKDKTARAAVRQYTFAASAGFIGAHDREHATGIVSVCAEHDAAWGQLVAMIPVVNDEAVTEYAAAQDDDADDDNDNQDDSDQDQGDEDDRDDADDDQDDAATVDRNLLTVPCPVCGVDAGELCRSHDGARERRHDVHLPRTAAYKALVTEPEFSVPCPACESEPGELCTNSAGPIPPDATHGERFTALKVIHQAQPAKQPQKVTRTKAYNETVRAWARAQGHDVGVKGRISERIYSAYTAAQ